MTYTEFFENLNSGARWDVGVSINRSNSLPLDANAVFSSKASAEAYVAGTPDGGRLANAYPGQVLAVVTETETTIYYIGLSTAGAMTLNEVGAKVEAANASIEIVDGKISLGGFTDAEALTLPQKQADGSIAWVPISSIVEGDGNTVTAGDNVTIVTAGNADNLTASIKGYGEAGIGQILVKGENGVEWKDEYSYDDSALTESIGGLDGRVDTLEATSTTYGSDIDALELAVADRYTKSEADAKIAAEIGKQIHMNVVIVEEVPAVESAVAGTIYLVKDADAEGDMYKEYTLVADAEGNKTVIQIGDTSTDLSDYALASDVSADIQDAKTAAANDATSKANAAQAAAEATASADAASKASAAEQAAKAYADEQISEVNTTIGSLESDLNGKITAVDGKFANYTTTEALTELLGDKADSSTVATDIANAKTDVLNTVAQTYVTDQELESAIAAIPEAPVQTIDEVELSLTDGKLTIESVAQNKVTGLNKTTYTRVENTSDSGDVTISWNEQKTEATLADILVPASYDSATHTGQSGLMTPEDKEKLMSLVIDDDGSVGISGNVSVDNVTGLPTYLNKKIDEILMPDNTVLEITTTGEGLGKIVKVGLPYATLTAAGLVQNSFAENTISFDNGIGTVNSLNIDKLVQTVGTSITLYGGAAAGHVTV